MRNDDCKRDWWCVWLDETRHWNLTDEQKQHIERIVGVYIYDAREYTYCCEITPSHLLRFITGSIWFKPETPDEVRESIENDLARELYSGEDVYMHVSDVRTIAEDRKNHFGEIDDTDVERDKEEDVVREYYQGNCPF